MGVIRTESRGARHPVVPFGEHSGRGEGGGRVSQTVAASFVVTDLVDSTALASAVGPARAEELRGVHFGILRAAVEATGGFEVKNLGDGMMLMFTSTSRAIACAVDIQRSIDRTNRRAP